jgi:hypothetical protein
MVKAKSKRSRPTKVYNLTKKNVKALERKVGI